LPSISSGGATKHAAEPHLSRQRLIGWALIAVSVAYIAYFLRVRVLEPGPVVEKKEWVQLIGSIVVFMLGTINVRMAAMRARRRARR
jgi:uncharacterized membrane protein